MKNYKTKISNPILEGLISLISEYLSLEYVEADDKLIMATLAEVKLKLLKKALTPQHHYGLSLSPAQAIALQIFYTDYIGSFTTQVGNKLHQISNEVKQQYQ